MVPGKPIYHTVFNEYKMIFTLIPKNANTSIKYALIESFLNLDKKELVTMLNNKILKLTDVEIDSLIRKGNPDAFKPSGPAEPLGNEPNPFKESMLYEGVSDLKAALPLNIKEVERVNEKKEKVKVKEASNTDWEKNWKDKIVKIKSKK